MLFRQLFDPETSTYTYLLADDASRDAVIIDPVREQLARDLDILEELGLTLRFALETHVHADHITGAGLLRERTGAQTVVSKHGGAACADVLVNDGDIIKFGQHALEVRATPGHTDGCVTYVTADRHMAFTGDALLIRGCGRTDFQQGDARQLFRSVTDKVFSLPDDTKVFPGHDYKGRTVSTVAEEKAHNPRLKTGTTEDEFVHIMSELKLAHPKKIQEAVPANQRCGIAEAANVDDEITEKRRIPAAVVAPWAPIERTITGVPEVSVRWVMDTMSSGAYALVDVREPEELRDGVIAGAENVPLSTVTQVFRERDQHAPIVVVCRSGGRSGRAAMELLNLGFTHVASMQGGMMAWAGPTRRVA